MSRAASAPLSAPERRLYIHHSGGAACLCVYPAAKAQFRITGVRAVGACELTHRADAVTLLSLWRQVLTAHQQDIILTTNAADWRLYRWADEHVTRLVGCYGTCVRQCFCGRVRQDAACVCG